jgi:hypothetical protein
MATGRSIEMEVGVRLEQVGYGRLGIETLSAFVLKQARHERGMTLFINLAFTTFPGPCSKTLCVRSDGKRYAPMNELV